MAESTYISLFAGAGGLDLGLRIALPQARCVGYVEGDLQAARLLEARIEDEGLDDAPIWSDVRTFRGAGWRGLVDGIIGGFPCQDLSVAGKRAGIDGERSGLWSEFARIIREVRPRWVFVENVAALLTNEYLRRVLGDLSALGFNAEWQRVSAVECGASHKRERVFILAFRPEMADPGHVRYAGTIASGQQSGFGGGRHGVSLHHVVAAWHTPRANDAEKRGDINMSNPRNGIVGQSITWSTPHAHNSQGAPGTEHQLRGGRHRDLVRESLDFPQTTIRGGSNAE